MFVVSVDHHARTVHVETDVDSRIARSRARRASHEIPVDTIRAPDHHVVGYVFDQTPFPPPAVETLNDFA
jgi:hypothetical protein